MYEKCIGNNFTMIGTQLMPIDNRESNDRIPVCYNRVLDDLQAGHQCWLMFCHEDFEMQERISEILAGVDKSIIYGPIGGELYPGRILWKARVKGFEEQCAKDGSNLRVVGGDPGNNRTVDTVDCQCLIVHSSLVEKYHLRFDEQLSFDFYTEDFSANAFIRHGIKTEVLPMKCRHWSDGSIQKRFFDQKAYLDQKYPKWEFFGSAGYTFGKGRSVFRRLQINGRRIVSKHCPWLERVIMKMI